MNNECWLDKPSSKVTKKALQRCLIFLPYEIIEVDWAVDFWIDKDVPN